MNLPPGVFLTPLKRIHNSKGDVFHCLKSIDTGFVGFGEAYFSTVHLGDVKGWKQHQRMTMNLVVPVGEVEFVLRASNGEGPFSVRLGESNYQRLTVPPGYWMAFRGMSSALNLVLNIADIIHHPEESISTSLETFPL